MFLLFVKLVTVCFNILPVAAVVIPVAATIYVAYKGWGYITETAGYISGATSKVVAFINWYRRTVVFFAEWSFDLVIC